MVSSPEHPKKKIVVLDEEPELHYFYQSCLQDQYDVICAGSVNEFAQVAQSSDAVLVDRCPSDSRFFSALKTSVGKPLLVVSGHLDRAYLHQVFKPFNEKDLQRKLDHLWKWVDVVHGCPPEVFLSPSEMKLGARVKSESAPEWGVGTISGEIEKRIVGVKWMIGDLTEEIWVPWEDLRRP